MAAGLHRRVPGHADRHGQYQVHLPDLRPGLSQCDRLRGGFFSAWPLPQRTGEDLLLGHAREARLCRFADDRFRLLSDRRSGGSRRFPLPGAQPAGIVREAGGPGYDHRVARPALPASPLRTGLRAPSRASEPVRHDRPGAGVPRRHHAGLEVASRSLLVSLAEALTDASTAGLDRPAPGFPDRILTAAMVVTWLSEPALQQRFDPMTPVGRRRLASWCRRQRWQYHDSKSRFRASASAMLRKIRPRIGQKPGASLVGYSRGIFGMGEHVRMSAMAMTSAQV